MSSQALPAGPHTENHGYLSMASLQSHPARRFSWVPDLLCVSPLCHPSLVRPVPPELHTDPVHTGREDFNKIGDMRKFGLR